MPVYFRSNNVMRGWHQY